MNAFQLAPEDSALALSHLATLVEAEAAPAEALAAVARHAEGRPLKAALAEAQRLAAAQAAPATTFSILTSSPDFSRAFAEAARARGLGEAGVLRALADHEQRSPQVRLFSGADSVLFACYVGVLGITWLFMITFVLPTFSSMFKGLGSDLPLPTRLVMMLGGPIRDFWFVIVVVAFVVYALRNRIAVVRRVRASVSSTVPPLRQAVRLVSACQYLNALATCARAGFTLADAHPLAARAVTHPVWRGRLERAVEASRRGAVPLAEALESEVGIPPRLAGVLDVAERSRRPEQTLAEGSTELESYVAARLGQTRQLVRVSALLLIGALVGSVVIALYLPIFSLATLIK